jgi:putative peptidoglycan lipid II flippase
MSRARSISTLTILNLLGTVFGLGISVVTANLFGTSREMEIFFSATILHQIVLRFVQGGQISEALLPIYHRLRASEGLPTARAAYAVTLNWVMLSTMVLFAFTWFTAPLLLQVLVPGFDEGDRLLGTRFFRIIAFLMPLQVIGALQLCLSNAEKWFGRPELMGIVAQGCNIVLIPTLAYFCGIWALVWAMVISQIVNNLGYLWIAHRLGYRHQWRLKTTSFSPREVFGKLFTTSGHMLTAQLFGAALSAGLSLLPQGSYAVFNYVRRIEVKIAGVFLRPVSTVFFTYFVEALQYNISKVRQLAKSALSKTILFSIFAMAALSVSALPLLKGLWGSRQFPPGQLEQAAVLLVLLMVLLIPQAVNTIFRKLLVAVGMMGPLYTAMAVNLLAAAPLARWVAPQHGLPGVVMLLYAVQVSQVAVGWYLLRRSHTRLLFSPDWEHLARSLLAAGIGALVIISCANVLGLRAIEASRWIQLLSAGCLCGATILLSSILALMLNVQEIRTLWHMILAKCRWAS